MGLSGLCSGVILSPYTRSVQNRVVDSVAIHTMAGNMTAENCGYWFQSSNANASSNYGVDSEGIIYGYVDEDQAAITTNSSGVDGRAITIEVASLTDKEPFECSSKAYEALINLLVDICIRHNINLRWRNDESYAKAAARGGPVALQNMFVHRWFNPQKSCPGQFLMERQGRIADDVNTRLRSGGRAVPLLQYSQFDSSKNLEGKPVVIFIGDSRTVQMQTYVGSNQDIWSCKVSMAYDWMVKTGVPAIENSVNSNTGVCFLMGINDMSYRKASDYSNYINQCAQRWSAKGACTYFVSVNPVGSPGSGRYQSITNDKIQKWNQEVRNGLSSNVGYIDTYSVIISNYNTVDGLHYDKNTSLAIYNAIKSAVTSGTLSQYSNSATIGGRPIQIDYTKLNPYIVTIDRSTSASMRYDSLKASGVVGAILEVGYLFDSQHIKVQKFQQPLFEQQLHRINEANLECGYYVTSRARNVSEANSEIFELSIILRRRPPRLGVWVKFEPTSDKATNDAIIDQYKSALIRLGFIGRIGLYLTKESLDKISWNQHQDSWLLWIIDHVQDTSDLKTLLDPEFFDMDGI